MSILARVMWSKAVAFSPDSTRPPLYAELPFARTDVGIVTRNEIWEKWLLNTLGARVTARVDALRDLRIRLEVGNHDRVIGESLAFADSLSAHEVPFSLVVFEGGHVEGVRRQFETSLFVFFDDFFRGR